MALSKEILLRATNKGMAVFRHFIPFPFQVGRNFLNPLYQDKNASCNVFFDRRNDCYRLKDFGNDDYSGDCFAFVGKLCGLDCNRPIEFIQILERINNELHLGLSDGKDYKPLAIASSKQTPVIPTVQTPTSVPIKKGRPYKVVQKNFSQQELTWWTQYGIIEKLLLSFHIVSLSRFDSENQEGKPFYFQKDINDSHRSTFADLLKLQGKVKGNLLEKAERCKFICIVRLNASPIAIGGIKPKTKEDFESDKADLMNIESSFEWELGYIYTDKDFSGKGIASNLVKILIEEFGSGNLMASAEINANPGMVRILEKSGFRHYGKPWKSGIHDNYLGLFLRFK